ncbi:MAG: precorrin-2/cobalt-factor-2 C20-methyltransferase [Halocynthiibacter sp.]|jgi:precorrin-2/cobalt-factor-2 C20-methyltransferase
MAPLDAGNAVEHDQAMSGTLYGVGLGPGDPDLMTLKAARLIAAAKVIAYPTLAGAESFARQIAAEFIAPDAQEIAMDVPMVVERGPARAAYDKGADEIAKALEAGQDVVCLCEGDPFFYGSFMYLFDRLAGRFAVEVVPGVSSITACAAAAHLPLVSRNEVLTVLAGPLPEADLAAGLAQADAVAIMKVGRHLPKIRRVIEAAGLTDRATYVERGTLKAQIVLPLKDVPLTAPYFSMILIRKETAL